MDIDIAVKDDGAVTDDAANKLIAGEHATGVGGKKMQQAKFGGGKTQALAVDADFMPTGIDDSEPISMRSGPSMSFAGCTLPPRRIFALMRATNSRGLKGLVM